MSLCLNGAPDPGAHTGVRYYANPDRCDNAKQAVAFAGLDPRQHELGSSVRGKPRMSKIAIASCARCCMPTMVAVHKTSWGRRFGQRLRDAGKAPKQIIGTMVRELVHVAFGVLRSGKISDPTLYTA